MRNLPERAILIAEDLKPSQLVSLDATRITGICLAAGGPTSHVAILAAAMGMSPASADAIRVVRPDPAPAVSEVVGAIDAPGGPDGH